MILSGKTIPKLSSDEKDIDDDRNCLSNFSDLVVSLHDLLNASLQALKIWPIVFAYTKNFC
jgi:hypothetical protein